MSHSVPPSPPAAVTPGLNNQTPVRGQQADAPVAVFDSGVGGLSVLRSLMACLPAESFVFMADSAWVPYGDKPHDTIVERTLAMARHAHDVLQAKAFVIACNTATAAAVAQVRQTWPDWIVVGIEPAVKPAALQTRSGVIGILATSNTLASDRFRSLVEGFAGDCRVVAQPCPGLVECVEAGDLDGPAVRGLLQGYVGSLKSAGADVIVLGCTHYPFLSATIEAIAGPGVQVLETGDAVARETRRRLEVAGLLRPEGLSGADAERQAPSGAGQKAAGLQAARVRLVSTGQPDALGQAARHLLGLDAPLAKVAC